jgi:hypothetical protein
MADPSRTYEIEETDVSVNERGRIVGGYIIKIKSHLLPAVDRHYLVKVVASWETPREVEA